MAKSLTAPSAPSEGTPAPDAPAPSRTRAARPIRAKATQPTKPRRRSPEPPVVLSYLPDRITVIGDRVLPALVHHPLVPGAGGIRLLKDGSWDWRGLRDDDEQRGAIFLDPSRLAYIGEDEAGELFNTWSNAADYVAFLDELIEAGEIPAPTVDEVRHFLETQTQIRDATRVQSRNPEAYTPEIERQIAVAQRWLATQEGK